VEVLAGFVWFLRAGPGKLIWDRSGATA